MDLFLKLSLFLFLFAGIGSLTTLGFIDAASTSTAFVDNVPIGFFLLFIFLTISFFRKQIHFNRNEILLLAVSCLYITAKVIEGGSANVTFLVNAFLGPSLLLIALRKAKTNQSIILKMILLYFLTECIIAIFERITGHNILRFSDFQSSIESAYQSNTFRSVSIHGHPLQGALILTIIMGFIYISSISITRKMTLLFLGFIGILSFNTRSSIVYWGGLLSIFIILLLSSSKINRKVKIIATLCSIIGVIILLRAIQMGWGGRLINMALFDENSAAVRIELFYIFRFLSWPDILWGIPVDDIEYYKYLSGIAIIENYWVIFILSFGLIMTLIFVLLTTLCLKPLFKNYSLIQKCIAIGSFLLISSTNNSMATNSPAMFILVMCAYAFPIYNKKIKRNDSQKDSLLLVRKKTTTKTSTQMY